MTAPGERKIDNGSSPKENRVCLPDSFTLGSFWQAIGRGEPFYPPPPQEIEEMVYRVFFATAPLYPLTPDEGQRLQKYLNDLTSKRLWDNSLALASKPLIVCRERKKDAYGIPKEEDVYYSGEEARRLYEEGFPYLTPAQKIELFTDPEFWLTHRSVQTRENTYEQLSGGYTNRPFVKPPEELYDNSYGIQFEELNPIIEGYVSQDVVTLIADLGGDRGRALAQVLERYRNRGYPVEGLNITAHEPLAKYPGMTHLMVAAERLPAELFEKVDVFISRGAFMHFLYPEMALKNVLLALAVGGYANFDFQLCITAENWNHFERLRQIGNIVNAIENLRGKTLISVDFYHQNYEGLERPIEMKDFFEDLAYRWSGQIPKLKIRKHGPIRAEDLTSF